MTWTRGPPCVHDGVAFTQREQNGNVNRRPYV
jgi:hypothetical protein